MKTPATFLAVFASIALSSLTLVASDLKPIAPVAQDSLTMLPAGSVQLAGPIDTAIKTCIDGRIKKQNIDDLIKPFAVREEAGTWRTEFWGKWFTSAVLAYKYQPTPELRKILDRAVNELIATQTPDGYIGTYQKSAETTGWDIWGRKYVLLGLLAYYDITGEKKVLEAACKEADYTISQVGPGKKDIVKCGEWNGMAASSILEPIVLLYQRSGEQRYLDFARYIVAQWETPAGPDLVNKALKDISVFDMFEKPKKVIKEYGDAGKSKAYEMMSCYEGLVELYRITGKPEYLEAARKVFANINATEITILGSGSSMERWCNGHVRQTENVPEWMETCVTVTWMKFATQLLRMTGDSRYADQIEKSTYNALLGAQKNDGTWWCHYSQMLGNRGPAPEQCGMHMNCCVANGPRGLMLLPALAVMKNTAGPVINLYEKGQATVDLPSGKKVKLDIQGDYPRDGKITIVVQPETEEQFTVALRIPEWSKQTTVAVNRQALPDVQPGKYLNINRSWQPGDTIQLNFDMRVRLVQDPGKTQHVALVRGPVTLALDRRITSPQPGVMATILSDNDAIVDAIEVTEGLPDEIPWAVDVPCKTADGKTVSLRMCPYMFAGRTWSEASTLQVWLPQPLDLGKLFSW